jgi:hypothetical protein
MNRIISRTLGYFLLLYMAFPSQLKLQAQLPPDYQGKQFKPHECFEGAQRIPGRIELAWYDLGGEGIAFHDLDSVNHGAMLSYHPDHDPSGISETIAFFRQDEGVDISYTKHWVDFEVCNLVDPKIGQQYIGWQEDGEWTNYTVDVKVAGRYRIIALYSNKDNGTSLWLNGEPAVQMKLPQDTGYWHCWNKVTVGEIEFLHEGLNLLTLKYNTGANLAFLDFVLISKMEK